MSPRPCLRKTPSSRPPYPCPSPFQRGSSPAPSRARFATWTSTAKAFLDCTVGTLSAMTVLTGCGGRAHVSDVQPACSAPFGTRRESIFNLIVLRVLLLRRRHLQCFRQSDILRALLGEHLTRYQDLLQVSTPPRHLTRCRGLLRMSLGLGARRDLLRALLGTPSWLLAGRRELQLKDQLDFETQLGRSGTRGQ